MIAGINGNFVALLEEARRLRREVALLRELLVLVDQLPIQQRPSSMASANSAVGRSLPEK